MSIERKFKIQKLTMADLTLFDCIRVVALVVGFAAGFRQRKNAILADIVFTGWLGLCFFLLPEKFMEQQVKDGTKLDSISIYGARAFGCWLLGPLVMWVLGRKSRDESVIGALLWSRIVGMMMVTLMMLYGHYTYKFFSDRHLWFTVLFCGLIWLSSVLQMVRTRPPVGRREEKGAISLVTRIYFLFTFLYGMVFMAFPKLVQATVTNSEENIHLYLIRIVGALMFGNCFIIWYVPSFRYNEDRKSFFITQLVSFALIVVTTTLLCMDGAVNRTQAMYQFAMLLPYLLPVAGLLMMLREERRTYTNSYSLRSRS